MSGGTRTDGAGNGNGTQAGRVPSHPRVGRVGSMGQRRRLMAVCGLWALWVLLWGSVSAIVLLSGGLVALAVTLIYPAPTSAARLRVRPWPLLVLLAHTGADLVVSGATVAWAALRQGPAVRSAVVEVPLRTDVDLLVDGVVQLTSLTPGSLVLEIDRETRRVYVHVLPVTGPEDADRRREKVTATERRVLRAFDSVPAVPHDADAGGRGDEDPGTGGIPGGSGKTPGDGRQEAAGSDALRRDRRDGGAAPHRGEDPS